MRRVATVFGWMLMIVAACAGRAGAVQATGAVQTRATGPGSAVAASGPTTAPSSSHLRAAPLPLKFVPPETTKVARPTTAVDAAGCVTSQCHTNVKGFKVLHGPLNVDSCDACHKPVNEKLHTFEPRRPKAELCTFCHQTMKPEETVVHKPLTQGDCVGCHNPHGGENRSFLHGKTIADLCSRCHENVATPGMTGHEPVTKGSCNLCHEPHSSRFPKLVKAQGSDLCYTCHDKLKAQVASAKFVHKALVEKQTCEQCHEVHASPQAKLLKRPTLELCESCHEKQKTLVASAPVKHSATTTGQACLTCHTPHGGDVAKLMNKPEINACMSCHDKQIVVSKDRIVPIMTALTDPHQFKHGPIQKGECSGCHAPHGGENPRLLVKAYSQPLYQPFSVEKYALCFSCHDPKLAVTEKTAVATKFRNGEQNLHFVHVTKGDRGRSCATCHATHTANDAQQVRETVAFGRWQMPIAFRPTPTGGSCAAGCHRPLAYDRDKPVPNHLELNPSMITTNVKPVVPAAPAAPAKR